MLPRHCKLIKIKLRVHLKKQINAILEISELSLVFFSLHSAVSKAHIFLVVLFGQSHSSLVCLISPLANKKIKGL